MGTSLHSEHYQLSGMLIRQQDPFVSHSKQRSSRHEAQSRGIGQQNKNSPYVL
jgi:hypothetical protein